MYKSLLKQKEKILTCGMYLLVFLYSVYPETDNDLGWHYRYGEYFFKNGKILKEDIYSWTLTGYQWVNHSWLYDIFLYPLYNSFGYTGLSIISALIVCFTFWVVVSHFRLTYWKIALLGLVFIFLTQVGIEEGLRSQVVSLSLFGILMRILIESKDKPKRMFWLAPLFLFWTNMHADFVLGILVAFLFVIYYSLFTYFTKVGNLYSYVRSYTVPFIVSVAVTFINPFTYMIYTESPRHLGNPYLKNVLEWDPIFDNCGSCHPYIYIFYSAILLLVFLWSLKKRDFATVPYAIIAALFFWATYNTRRFAPVYMVLTLPLLAYTLEQLKFKLEKFKITPYLFALIIIVGIEFTLYNRFNDFHLYHFTEEDYSLRSAGCSVLAANYLIEHPPYGRGFNMYDWGGYLIGKGIPAKLFIDGRMHVWKDENGYQPFSDYIQMYYNGNYNLFNKYDFDWLLVPDSSNIAQRLMTSQDLGVWKLEFQEGGSDYFVRVR